MIEMVERPLVAIESKKPVSRDWGFHDVRGRLEQEPFAAAGEILDLLALVLGRF